MPIGRCGARSCKAEEEARRKAEEERLRLEAEERAAAEKAAKKDAKKGPAKKGKAEVAVEEPKEEPPQEEPAAEEAADGGDAEPPAPAVQTPEQKIAILIEQQVQAKAHKPNIIVDGLNFDEEGYNFLYVNRLLPETVIMVDSQQPRAEGEEGEEGEPEPAPEAEGGEGAAPVKKEGPFDRTDGKLYQKYMDEWVAKFNLDPTEEDAVPEEAGGEEDGGVAGGDRPPPGKAPPRQEVWVGSV